MGPNSSKGPGIGKTADDIRKGKSARRMGNKHRCQIREAGGKFKGIDANCPVHPVK
jgi:hypothetical protein